VSCCSRQKTNTLGFILEPFGRNTAAAVAAAALQLQQVYGPQALMLVLAADHLIKREAAFFEAVGTATHLASQGWLVTFGIKPRYPETGFGYIEAAEGGALGDGLKVQRFVEKPDLKTAQGYVAAGNYFSASMRQMYWTVSSKRYRGPVALLPMATGAWRWNPNNSLTCRIYPSTMH
jgi:mannose-1-phosphate guanylyltransferase